MFPNPAFGTVVAISVRASVGLAMSRNAINQSMSRGMSTAFSRTQYWGVGTKFGSAFCLSVVLLLEAGLCRLSSLTSTDAARRSK